MIVDHLGRRIRRPRVVVRVVPSKFVRGRPQPTPESDVFEQLGAELRRRELIRQRTPVLRVR